MSNWIKVDVNTPHKPAIGSITYRPQGYDRTAKLYEDELTFV